MKSATLPRTEDKRIVRSALPSSNIFTAAVARLYVSFSINEWKYSGLWGAVAFCKDRDRNNSYFIRLIDMEYGHSVVWEQELYEGFEYVKDCSFFHTFETDDYLAGLLFVHQGEADVFFEKVLNRESIKLKDNHRSVMKSHVGQVTYIPGKGFSVDNNDPEVLQILHELEKLDDFSPADIVKNQDFIQSFINQYRSNNKKSKRGPPPPPPPSRNRTRTSPPPIPPMINRQNSLNRASPPPLPNRGIRQTPSMSSLNSSSPPRTPLPSNTVPLPPPPPPMPNANPILPTSSDAGRNSLMAAIRSTGGFGSLKKSGTLKNVSPNEKNGLQKSTHKFNGGNDMASSLAAVLNQRKTAMQSDDENEDDDDDWK